MKLGANLRTKAIASAEIAAKPRALVSSRFYSSQPARCASLARRDTRPPNPYVAGTPCVTIAQPVEGSYSVESWAGTASIRSTPGRSMSPGSLIRRSRSSYATNRIGFLCPRASPYSTRCQGNDALERTHDLEEPACARRTRGSLPGEPSTSPLDVRVAGSSVPSVRQRATSASLVEFRPPQRSARSSRA